MPARLRSAAMPVGQVEQVLSQVTYPGTNSAERDHGFVHLRVSSPG